jgi:hypothetical protein
VTDDHAAGPFHRSDRSSDVGRIAQPKSEMDDAATRTSYLQFAFKNEDGAPAPNAA